MKHCLKIGMNRPACFTKKSIAALLLLFVIENCAFGLDNTINQFIVISNTLPVDRNNEVVIVQRSRLSKVNNILCPVVLKGSKVLTTQTIDNNNDSSWDALLVEVSLAANSKDTLQITWVKKNEQVLFNKLTNVRLSLRSDDSNPSEEINHAVRYRGFTQNIAKPFYQMEGPGIENDRVAFRAFFDYRNGKDIYGKITGTPVLEKVGVGASWHEMQYWGKDILKVGNSLGAGALAVQEDGQIYRLADADTTVFDILYEGPLQAAFKLDFKNWDAGTSRKNGNETISITKADFYYKNEISLSLNSLQYLIAGMANFGMDKVIYQNHNASFTSVATYGKQAEGTATSLGLAIMFRSAEYIGNKTSDSVSVIPNTTYAVLKPSAKKTIYFFACWEKTDGRFASLKGFENYLQAVADKLASPIQVKVIDKK